MRVYSLRIGATKVPYGQFYGGLAGWTGLRALYRFATDKSHFIVVPIHAYLIDHPNHGLTLVDTGINWDQTHYHGTYYKGIAHYLFDDDEYLLERSEELPAVLKQIGYTIGAIKRVIATHLHEDHIGGLAYLPDAEVIVSAAEWAYRGLKMFGFVPIVYAPSLPPVDRARMIDFQDAPIAGFGATHDVFKDGSVVLLPTPGHSPGHLCVLINLDGYRLLVAGDCLYTLRHLANGDVQAFGAGKWMKMQNDSIKKIQRLAEASDNLVVVPVHDHTAYQFEYLEPMLAKGYLTPEDRDKIKIYVSDIFDGGWRLKASHRPAYIPGANKERIGTVKE